MTHIGKFIRTCQSCGNQQEDNPPSRERELSDAYCSRKCRKCRSEDLDYGSYKSEDNEDWTDDTIDDKA